jgi:hypothetical protein
MKTRRKKANDWPLPFKLFLVLDAAAFVYLIYVFFSDPIVAGSLLPH